MAKRHLTTAETELILAVMAGNRTQIHNFSYDQIIRIQFDKCDERKLFKKVPSEKISIFTKRLADPIVFTKKKEGKFFDEYKAEIEKFCKDYRVKLLNNLSDTQA